MMPQALALMVFLAMLCISLGAIPPKSGNLEVYALPVGQGDCTIIQCPMGELVINDCGSSGGKGWSASDVKNYLGTRVNDIKAIYISHSNKDHYSYLPTITSSANPSIQAVIIGGVANDYPSSIRNWLTAFGGKLWLINNGASCIGTANCKVPGAMNFCNNLNISFNILAANVGPSSNQKSIVLKVVYSSFNILLPGDMEGPASITIANTLKAQLQSYIYKMAHHGASTQANQQAWLDEIKPPRAFASSAYNFGNCRHPRCETINRIQNLNTITTATPHAFYCGNSGAPPTNNPSFAKHMYETSPTSTSICLLTYTSTTAFSESCKPALTSATEPLESGIRDDDECFPEDLEVITP